MDRVSRLIRSVLVAVAFVGSPVFAAPAFWDLYMAGSPVDFGSAADAAQGYVNWRNDTKTCTNGCYYVLGNVTSTTATKVGYKVRLFNGSGVEQTPTYVDFVPHCRIDGQVTGVTLVGGVPTCPDTNTCPAAGTVIQPEGTVFEAGNGLTTSLCLAGCGATSFMAAKHEGKNWVWGPIKSTGSQCAVTSAPDVSEASPKCSVGQCPGTLNGNQICVPCAETKEDTKASSSETAASAASGAAPGSGQTTTNSGSSSTTCAGGTCTTTGTETVTNPDGSTETKTTSTTQSKGDYCKENPKAGACVGSESTWGGTCGSFVCDGDAVQCAQAKAGWELACGLKVDETNPLIGVGQQATAGGDRPADHPGNQANTVALDLSSRLSSVPLFGTSGDCIADKPITFMGKGYTLPFSKWCPYLNILGSAFLAACYLAAAFIIFRD